jgi:hypothetical protein
MSTTTSTKRLTKNNNDNTNRDPSRNMLTSITIKFPSALSPMYYGITPFSIYEGVTQKQSREQQQQQQQQQLRGNNDNKTHDRNANRNEKGQKTDLVTAAPLSQYHPVGIEETVTVTLEELRQMRQEMISLRLELLRLKRHVIGDTRMEDDDEQESTLLLLSPPPPKSIRDETLSPQHQQQQQQQQQQLDKITMKQRQREFERISWEVEQWSKKLLFGDHQEGDNDVWTEMKPNNVIRGMFNRDGRTRAYITWLPDSRHERYRISDDDDDGTRLYPCMKIYSSVDAPFSHVCWYLSQKNHLRDYNDLIADQHDVEIITPSSKICWAQTPQILFIKPRQFTTFCAHRWLKDGTQVVINHAMTSSSYANVGAGRITQSTTTTTPTTMDTTNNNMPKAYALRGANYICPDPDDPENRTLVAMLAHASPGTDIPQWACKTAVNTLAPVEPFKLFHKINQGVKRASLQQQQQQKQQEGGTEPITTMVDAEDFRPGTAHRDNTTRDGRSHRPAGIGQMGYACFWPEGGGLIEKSPVVVTPPPPTSPSPSPTEGGE